MRDVVNTGDQVLIAFFESNQAALRGLGLVAPQTRGLRRRTDAAVVASKEADGSGSTVEPSWASPMWALLGAGLGSILGLIGGEAGLVVGLFFGLYAGVIVGAWRRLARLDLLDNIQAGLAPGHAALVAFVRGSSADIELRLAASDAVVVHLFPGVPIEDDFAREVREVTGELRLLTAAPGVAEGSAADRDRRIAAALHRLSVLEPFAGRLLWLERLQFEFEIDVLKREARQSPSWLAGRSRERARRLRASHRRSRAVLEASTARIRSAEAFDAALEIGRLEAA